MTKGAKVLVSVIYYIVCFIIGFMLAMSLPYALFYNGTMKYVETSLKDGSYSEAIKIVGGFYNEDYVLNEQIDDGGLVLFETVTIVYKLDEEGNQTNDESQIHKAYSGFLYGVRDTYDITSIENNKSSIGIFNGDGIEDKSSIIEYSTNSRDKDTNSGIYLYDNLYIDLGEDDYGSITKIIFYDKNDNIYKEIECNLDFSGTFYNDVDNFVTEYNKDFTNEELGNLRDEFLNKSDKYHISSYGPIQKKANRKAITLIILYFVCVYILGDIALGKRYVIKGIKWVLKKVFKVKFKNDEKTNAEDVLGHDYYCSLKLSLDIDDAPDLVTAVVIKYSNETLDDVEFDLIKDEEYTKTKRIKAGTYLNPYISLDENYRLCDLPDTLKVDGYSKEIKIKVKHKEG